jgi:hypothetical protein
MQTHLYVKVLLSTSRKLSSKSGGLLKHVLLHCQGSRPASAALAADEARHPRRSAQAAAAAEQFSLSQYIACIEPE